MVTTIPIDVSENEACYLLSQYEYAAKKDRYNIQQAVREVKNYNRTPKDEWDRDTFEALEKELKCARAQYRETLRLKLLYKKIVSAF